MLFFFPSTMVLSASMLNQVAVFSEPINRYYRQGQLSMTSSLACSFPHTLDRSSAGCHSKPNEHCLLAESSKWRGSIGSNIHQGGFERVSERSRLRALWLRELPSSSNNLIVFFLYQIGHSRSDLAHFTLVLALNCVFVCTC